MARLGVVVQARTGSLRLPGKVIKPFAGHASMLDYLLDGITSQCPNLPVSVATTTLRQDDDIVKICSKRGIDVFRGPESNVLERFVLAAREFDFDELVRVTADNPFVDGILICEFLKSWDSKAMDYLSNKIGFGYPVGTDVEIFTLSALEELSTQSPNLDEQEHVTLGFYRRHRSSFRLNSLSRECDELTLARLTVDTKAEFEVANAIAGRLERTPTQPAWVLAAKIFVKTDLTFPNAAH